LRLAGEAHRLAVADELECAEHADAQQEGPLRACVVRCDQAVPRDELRFEIKQVALAGSSVHEELNHPPRFGSIMWQRALP